jgi:predicted acylesterase/phospholipase RssA
VRRKFAIETPGISTGYWKARKIPCRERSSGSISRISSSLELDVAPGDLVAGVSGEDLRERALAGAVGSHDRMDLPLVDLEVHAVEDFDVLVGHLGEEVPDRENGGVRDQVAPLQRRALWVNGIRSPSLFQGDPLRATIERLLPHGDWGAYPIPVQVNAVELGTGRTEWFGAGARTDVTPAQAIYASAALPVFYPPATLPGGVYVDGGTLDALPLLRAAELGATGIVAVDVGSGGEVNGGEVAAKGMLSVHQRVFSIMAARRRLDTVRDWSGPPLLYLRPRLDGYGTFDFHHIPYFLDEGARAARELLKVPAAVL